MTLYRNLGPICFQCETDNFQIFSTEDLTLIIQFKNYFQIDLEELQNLLSVYALILKQQGLLQVYEQKNKPASILIHKTNRVKFDKISIELLCRIIKQLCLSVLHSERIIPEKFGEINKELFFQIDGELRYLYFPTKKMDSKKQNQQSSNQQTQNFKKIIQFFQQLKDEKQLSHRLLLKKFSKCSSVEQIIDETQYFMNIYYAKQNQAQLSNFSITNYTNNHQNIHTNTKQLQKTKHFNKIFQQNKNDNKIDKKFTLNLQVSNNGNKTNRSRKFQLFKNASLNPNKSFGSFTQKSSTIFSNTWRKLYKQNKFNDNSFRSNSRTLHIDANQKIINKSVSASLFGRDFSLTQSKKISSSKKKNTCINLNQNDRVQVSLHDSNFKNKSRLISQKKSLIKQNEQNYPEQSLNQSVLLNESMISNQRKSKNQNQSSAWMKQMVRNSLQKSKSKHNDNTKFYSKMTTAERSTYIDSRSKIIQKEQRKTFDTKQSQISNLLPKKTENTGSDPMSCNTLKSSDKNLKKKCLGIQTNNDQNQSVVQIINNKSNILPPKQNQKNPSKIYQNRIQKIPDIIKQKNPSLDDDEDIQSLQQIRFVQSSIQKITVKNNKHEQEKTHFERKKTSIKDLQANDQSFKKLSDQSQTERIKYSNISKKNHNSNENCKNHQIDMKKQDKKSQMNIVLEKQIKTLFNKLSVLCKQKQQIDYIGLAVVQTHDHLKVFQSIFWQLPMFFLYKKFYEKRLKLLQKINQFQSNIPKNLESTQSFKQLQNYSCKFQEEVRIQNQNIEQSLKKLLKTAKKKIKKSYPDEQEQQYIQKFLHLDYTIAYDSVLDQFVSMYVCSLQQARPQFIELTYHMVQVFEALIICKGGQISEQQKNKIFQPKSSKSSKINNYEAYYQNLLKRKQIKSILSRGSQKSQRQKQKQQDKKKSKNKNKN